MSLRFNLIKDIDTFKNDAFLGLTGKEVGLCVVALVTGGITYFSTQQFLGDDIASILCLIVTTPFGFIALYKKNGMSFVEYIKAYRELKLQNKTLYFSSYDVNLLENHQIKMEEIKKEKRGNKHDR